MKGEYGTDRLFVRIGGSDLAHDHHAGSVAVCADRHDFRNGQKA